VESVENYKEATEKQRKKASYISHFNTHHSFGSLTTVAYQFVPPVATGSGGGVEPGGVDKIGVKGGGVKNSSVETDGDKRSSVKGGGVKGSGIKTDGDKPSDLKRSDIETDGVVGVGERPRKKKRSEIETLHVYFLNDGFGTAVRVRNFYCQSFLGMHFCTGRHCLWCRWENTSIGMERVDQKSFALEQLL